MGHMQPISPEISEQSTHDIASLAAQNEVDRVPGGQASPGDVVEVDTVHDEVSRSLIDERLKMCAYRLHHVLPSIAERLTASFRVSVRAAFASKVDERIRKAVVVGWRPPRRQ